MNYKEIVKSLRDTARDQLRTGKISALQARLVMLDNDISNLNKSIEEGKKNIVAHQYAIDKVNLEKKSGLVNPDYERIVKRNEKAIKSEEKEIAELEKSILETRKEKVLIRKEQKEFADGTKKFQLEKINNLTEELIAEFFKAKGVHDALTVVDTKEEATKEEKEDADATKDLIAEDEEESEDF